MGKTPYPLVLSFFCVISLGRVPKGPCWQPAPNFISLCKKQYPWLCGGRGRGWGPEATWCLLEFLCRRPMQLSVNLALRTGCIRLVAPNPLLQKKTLLFK